MYDAKYRPEAFSDELDQRIADAEMEADYAARPRSNKDDALALAEREHEDWKAEQRRALPQRFK